MGPKGLKIIVQMNLLKFNQNHVRVTARAVNSDELNAALRAEDMRRAIPIL